jgi:hypothetical protein
LKQRLDRVEDAAEEDERQDHDVRDERVVVEGVGEDPDDRAERTEDHDPEHDGRGQDERLLDPDARDGQRQRRQRDADRKRAHDAADRVAEVQLPRVHRRR